MFQGDTTGKGLKHGMEPVSFFSTGRGRVCLVNLLSMGPHFIFPLQLHTGALLSLSRQPGQMPQQGAFF